MLSVMAAVLCALGWLTYEWLCNTPVPFHWLWAAAGLVALGFTLEWVFFEDLWVMDRRTRTAYWCRPFRRTRPIALDDGLCVEARASGGALEVHLVLKDGRRLWLTKDRRETIAAALPEFAQFIGLPLNEPPAA